MLCSIPSCDNPGAWPGERYCLRHYFVPHARRVREVASEQWRGWPDRFRIFGRSR